PVKWTSERLESFVTDSHARDVVADCEMVFDADGKVTGLRVSADYSVGAYVAPSGGISPMFFTLLLSGVYAIPAISVVTRCQFTNTISTAPYRGAGRPEAAFVLERLMDMAAQELGTDPVELRRKNMIKSDQMPYQTALMHAYDSGEFEQIMDEAVEKSEWHSFQSRREKSKIGGKIRGIGLASYLEGAAPFNERMEIRFDPGGDVTIVAGTHSHGQGHETVYSQMVSEFLGVPYESIQLIQGDTDKVAMGRGTVGSRSMTVGGSALHLAAEEIIEKGKKIAGHLLEAGETDIEFDSGVFSVAGTDKQINIVEVAKSSYTLVMWPPHLGMGLEGIGTFNPGMGNFPNGCQIAEVEIDPETGKVELVNLVIVGDVGTVINPLLLEGQIHGGITQGVGQATLENIVYEGNSGQLLSASFQDYTMPRADDLPLYDVSSHPVPTTTNPLGVKGAGETGTVGAPAAVLNAIVNALSSVGVKDIEMPATSEKVWQALQNAA
ncbi:MAG TPA: xanthine dehydrogenase family protein molybdopterin-binding subunit, partial [Rhodospirillales bacterium]|nr:xanthine dehydrogenase family protein molybdopterin-binding subunit [Rhodospirillales bacterium]